jgi:hypothetical protein
MEKGRFLLENSRRACAGITDDSRVATRLEVGDPRAKVSQVAAEANCDRVVMSAYGVNALPHVDRAGQDTSQLREDISRPVVLVLPTGQGIRADAADVEAEDHEAAGVR